MHELWLVSVPRIYIHKKQYEYNNLSSWTMSNRFVHMITCEISSVFSDDHSLPWYSLPLFVLDLTKWVELYPYFDISLKLLKQKMVALASKTLLANCLRLIVSPRLIRVEIGWFILDCEVCTYQIAFLLLTQLLVSINGSPFEMVLNLLQNFLFLNSSTYNFILCKKKALKFVFL